MRRLFLIPLLLAAPALAQDNVDRPGNDYTSFLSANIKLCEHSCGAEKGCRAWTWVAQGYGPAAGKPFGLCFLKNSVPKPVNNDCCFSGTRGQISPRISQELEQLNDRPGGDYANFPEPEGGGPTICQKACMGQNRCVSWSYVHAAPGQPQGTCFLKDRMMPPARNRNVTSGVKWQQPSYSY